MIPQLSFQQALNKCLMGFIKTPEQVRQVIIPTDFTDLSVDGTRDLYRTGFLENIIRSMTENAACVRLVGLVLGGASSGTGAQKYK